MCFGNNTQTGSKTSTSTYPSWLANAGQSNLTYAQNLQSKGFQPYTGPQVANFSPQQTSSFGFGTDIANGVQPYVDQTGHLINNYANAGPQSVTPETIASQMSPYMNQYVNMALAPQLEQERQLFAGQNKSFDSAATGAGAFGDSSWNIGRTNLTNEQNIGNTGLVGNAYNAAFNTAIGAGAQDVANNLSGQTTNANLAETALGRQLTGATALNNIGTGAATLENTFGGQQTAQQQANLNAAYNQWLMSQQYPFQTTQLVNQTIGSAAGVNPATQTTTTSAPDNSGFGLIGSAVGAALPLIAAPFTGGASLALEPGVLAGGAALGQGGIGHAADGGRIAGPTIVGERGPELFIPHTSGVVVPHEVLKAAMEKREQAKKKNPKPNMQFGIAA